MAADALDIKLGQALFERNWVSAPSSTKSDDGLGPHYDATSCASCHTPRAPTNANGAALPQGIVVRLGNARGTGDPIYGFQLQRNAMIGQPVEAEPALHWVEKNGLRTANISASHLAFGTLAQDTKWALRRALSIKGAGLLAAIPENEILKHEDPNDANADGIKGRASWVMKGSTRVLGRFGWKATQPDLTLQTALAFSRDLGLSTRDYRDPWGDCSEAEKKCRSGPHGTDPGGYEIADAILDSVVRYVASVPPPYRSVTIDPGEAVFERTGCSACHATLHLSDGTPVPAFTDMLLHDLGAGLNDGMAEAGAGPGFWRTAPLWDVAGSLRQGGLLHDGRARNVIEAVEWHDGDARRATEKFRALTLADRAALVAFVSGL